MLYTNNQNLKYKYGIYEANAEMKKRPERAWDVVDSDENIGKPLEVFETLEAAKEALKKRNAWCSTFSSPIGKMYEATVYFIGENVLIDEDCEEKLYNMVNGDGWEVTPFFTVESRETGDIIDYCSSFEEAKELLIEYEEDDKENDCFKEDFYCVVRDGNHELMWAKGVYGVSARLLMKEYGAELKEQLYKGHLWNPSYYIATVSENTESQIRDYIKSQKCK